MNNQDKIIQKIVNSSGSKFSTADLKKAADGDMSSIMSKMKKEDSDKLKALLADPEKTKQLLSSDAATKLLSVLLGKDKNG